MQNNPEQAVTSINDSTLPADAAPYLMALDIPLSPFTNNIEQKPPYHDAVLEQLQNQLLHLLHSTELMLVVSAEEGGGKTTLMTLFLQRADASLKCFPITASAAMIEQDLLTKLAISLDVPDNLNKVAILDLLEEQALVLRQNDILPVILIDDAQHLHADTLALLKQLQEMSDKHGNKLWRIVLFTRATYTSELMLHDANMHFIYMPAMDEQQLGNYLQHRLKMVGCKQASPFSEKDIAFIHKHAQGNLSHAHLLAHQVLIKKFSQPISASTPKKTGFSKKHIMPVALSVSAAVLLSVILFNQDRINEIVDTDVNSDTSQTQQAYEVAMPQEYIIRKIPDAEPKPKVTLSKPKLQAVPAADKADSKAPADTTTASKKTIDVPAEQAMVKDKPANKLTEKATIKASDKAQAVASTASKPALKQASTKQNQTSRTDNKASSDLAAALKRHKILDRSWILQQAPDAYTAQLMASSRPDALYSSSKNNALQNKVAIYRILRKNKDWYVMIYGSYPNKDSMRAAVAKLPASLRKNAPWLRSFSAVQAELRTGKK